MTNDEIKQLIQQTVATTVQQLQSAGLLQGQDLTAYQKTEALLRQYPKLKEQPEPYARRLAQEVEACLAEAANDPYVGVIKLYYFDDLKNAACAKMLNCNERTCRRNRRKLVERFSARLASDSFIREILK